MKVEVKQLLWRDIKDSFVMLEGSNKDLRDIFIGKLRGDSIKLDYDHPYKYLKNGVRTFSFNVPSKYSGILGKLKEVGIELFSYTFPDLEPIKNFKGEDPVVVNLTGKLHIVATDNIGSLLGSETPGRILARVVATNGPGSNSPQGALERLLGILDRSLGF